MRIRLENLDFVVTFLMAIGLVALIVPFLPSRSDDAPPAPKRWCDYEAGVVCYGAIDTPSCLPWSQVEPVCAPSQGEALTGP